MCENLGCTCTHVKYAYPCQSIRKALELEAIQEQGISRLQCTKAFKPCAELTGSLAAGLGSGMTACKVATTGVQHI